MSGKHIQSDAAPMVNVSALAPLRVKAYRMLWAAGLMANLSTWMTDVASAWMMTSLTQVPLWVALVQTATTLPMFLLGLPSGAQADVLDRKKFLLATQIWCTLTAALFCTVAYLHWMTPMVLLGLVFANAIGLAMRLPVSMAVVPDLVPRVQVPAAMALSAVAWNASRILGPVLAGGLIASFGTASVYALNAVLSVLTAWMISRLPLHTPPDQLGRERLVTAIRVGLQYVGQSPHLKGVLLRTGVFFFCTAALVAMVPLLARALKGGDASTYTFLIASMGAGAIASTSVLQKWRARYSRDSLVWRSVVVQAISMAAMAWINHPWLAMPTMFVSGAAWLTTSNTLSVSSQMGLPNWVRARGMSISLVTGMGCSAAGAVVWGQIANWTSVPTGLVLAAGGLVVAMALVHRFWPDAGEADDLTPEHVVLSTDTAGPSPQGQVMMTIEYSVDLERADDFRALMLGEVRASRLRYGVLSWELLQDIHEPQKFVELIVDESWSDHLRRFERTARDVNLRDRKRAFLVSESKPRITRFSMQSTVKSPQ